MYLYLIFVARDILYELASVGDLPLPGASNNKRERDWDKGARSVPPPQQQQQQQPQEMLPMYSNELGQVPLHGEVQPPVDGWDDFGFPASAFE